jgi:hypothetical protein
VRLSDGDGIDIAGTHLLFRMVPETQGTETSY